MSKNQFLTIWILILGIAMTSILAVAAETPVEVERIKDLYYFKIHGKPSTMPGVNPTEGTAEFIYKNLSPTTQNIDIKVQVIYGGHDFGLTPGQRTLAPGEEWSDFRAGEDMDVVIAFEVWVEGVLKFADQIWIPPNNPS